MNEELLPNDELESEELEALEEPDFDKPSIKQQLGSILFVSVKPMTLAKLSSLVEEEESKVEPILKEISQELAQISLGLELKEVAGGWQLKTISSTRFLLRSLVSSSARRLSKAAAETLAVIAYKQPVLRSEIESIRGVDALPTIKTLIDLKLIKIIGHDNSPGQPALYGTTLLFLEKFGLKDLTELPSVREVFELEKELGESDVIEDTADTEDEQD